MGINMSDSGSLLIGFDLGNECSQISCYNNKTFEPESIALFPTVLAVKNDTKDWYYGEDAIELSKKGEGVLIKDMIDIMQSEKEIIIQGISFTVVGLLEKYLRKSLSLLKEYYPNDSIKRITFTLKELNISIRKTLMQALAVMGLNKDRVIIQSYSQSYFYYALSQKKELWMNDVGLFDFDEEGLHFSQISINRKMTPMLVGTTRKDFSETLSYELFLEDKDKENTQYIFENIAKNVLHKQIISTLYMTGKGFEGNWAEEIFAELCVGRRVFKGQNLYTKGACYTSRELAGEPKLNDFLFLSEDMVSSNISMKVYHDAVISEALLVKAGVPWYESDYCLNVILDQEEEIEIITKHIMKQDAISQIIVLDGLPKRPDRTTRVEIRAKFLDAKSCVITIKDKGFGEFYPTTNRIWEKIITI